MKTVYSSITEALLAVIDAYSREEDPTIRKELVELRRTLKNLRQRTKPSDM